LNREWLSANRLITTVYDVSDTAWRVLLSTNNGDAGETPLNAESAHAVDLSAASD
jgi:hypothetical protein